MGLAWMAVGWPSAALTQATPDKPKPPAASTTQPATTQPAGPAATAPAAGAAAAPNPPATTAAPSGAETANAPAPVDPETALSTFLQSARDSLGRSCAPRQIVADNDLRYLACGPAGMWIARRHADGHFELAAVQQERGEVESFFVQGGQLWAQVRSLTATPVARVIGDPISTAPVASPPQQPPPAMVSTVPPAPEPSPYARDRDTPRHRVGEVVEVGAGFVVVNLGSVDGVLDGSHVTFYSGRRSGFDELDVSSQQQRLATGIVDSFWQTRARVRLGVGERVPMHSRAQLSGEPLTASSLAPPRIPGLWEVGFLARPFLVLGDLGTGIVLDARAGYRTDHFHIEGLLLPLTLATAGDGTSFPSAAILAGSYESQLFEIGLGLGGQTVNDPEFGLDVGTGMTLLQRVRLGARDGLHLEAFSYVVLFHSEFEFSTLRVTGQIPLGRKTWLLLTGSGGTMGLGFGELGLRVLLEGNGDTDSLFITTTLGGVNVFEMAECFDFCEERVDYSGPLVGTGLEWRL